MRFKKLLATLLVSLTICTTTVTVAVPPLATEAHSGRTDSQGGHHDNKNKSGLGSYHYHCGGHPAHLHTNGVCPYANNAATADTTSSTTSSNDNSSKSTGNQVSVTQQNSNNTTNASKRSVTISDTSYDNVAFNASYYASQYEDLYKAFGDDAKSLYDHFITSGIYEGRQSSAQFSILVYKENNQDLVDAFGEDLIKYYNHFIEYGVNENRVSK